MATPTAPRGAVGFYGLASLLIFAPLFWGGNAPLPLFILELGALTLAAYAFWRPDFKEHLSPPLLGVLTVLFLVPVLQLIPLPQGLWASLPGRAYYAEALAQLAHNDLFEGLRAVSLIPFATEYAWLALLPPLVVFLVAVGLSTRQLQLLVVLFLGLATFQALLGLIQYGDGPDSVFRLGNPYMAGSASGTYVNRNHLAGLLEMALPVGLALLAATVGRSSQGSRYKSPKKRPLRRRLAALTTLRSNHAVLYGATALAILLGLIFTRSRTGVSLAILGILLCTLAFSHRLGGKNIYGLVGTFTAVGVGLAAVIGLAPVLDRFALKDPLSDGRWSIFTSTLQAIGQFFPLGSGSGTFVEVFHRFHPPDFAIGSYVNRAHNDYLEWILENGLIVAGLLAALLVFYLRQWPRVWQRGPWSTFRFVQVGAGIALLLMMLHSLVDFNLHIPANAIFFAFLAAVFFHRPSEEEPPRSRQSRRSEARKDSEEDRQPHPRAVPPENAINPFDR